MDDCVDRDRLTRLLTVDTQDDWERVLAAAAHLQRIVPDAVLVGGSAAALYVEHRFSRDDDHVVVDLKSRFDDVLRKLENVAAWRTARTRRPVLILGQLDGVDTGVRNLIRTAPLDVDRLETPYGSIVLPTIEEMLRIKSWLVVTRNATRDYIDAAALSDRVERTRGASAVDEALLAVDSLYPQDNGSSVTLQIARQFAEPKPFDYDDGRGLNVYRIRADAWRTWDAVCARLGVVAAALLAAYARRS